MSRFLRIFAGILFCASIVLFFFAFGEIDRYNGHAELYFIAFGACIISGVNFYCLAFIVKACEVYIEKQSVKFTTISKLIKNSLYQ